MWNCFQFWVIMNEWKGRQKKKKSSGKKFKGKQQKFH